MSSSSLHAGDRCIVRAMLAKQQADKNVIEELKEDFCDDSDAIQELPNIQEAGDVFVGGQILDRLLHLAGRYVLLPQVGE